MTLVSNLSALAVRVGTESKSLRTLINGNAPDLSALDTTAQTNLVAAINEIYGALATAAGINDATTTTTTTWSSSKIDTELTATHDSAVDDAINDTGTSSSSAWSSTKTDSELSTRLAALIDDVTASDDTVYSSNKVTVDIAAAVASLVDSAPGALDTLNELAAALGDDASFATTTSTALGNRLRFDASQTLSGGQKTQGLTNLGAQDASTIGDTTTNFVTGFEAALI